MQHKGHTEFIKSSKDRSNQFWEKLYKLEAWWLNQACHYTIDSDAEENWDARED